MFEIVTTDNDFSLAGREAPNFPLICNFVHEEGECVLRESNHFLRWTLEYESAASAMQYVKRRSRNLVRFFNYLLYEDETLKLTRDVFSVVEKDIVRFRQTLIDSGAVKEQSRNACVKDIYDFYWHCEKRMMLGHGLIGFNKPENDPPEIYDLPVRRPKKSKADYQLPNRLLESYVVGSDPSKTSESDWEKAYNAASHEGKQLSKRNALIIEIFWKTGIRREELVYLTTDSFKDAPDVNSANTTFYLPKTKVGSTGRYAEMPTWLYAKVRAFIKRQRRRAVKKDIADNSLFLSTWGCRLDESSVNKMLKKYGADLRPHDARKICLTSIFIDLLEQGHDKETAMLIASERAGHSIKGKGVTLERHYLEAKKLLELRGKATLQQELDAERLRAKRLAQENEELKAQLERRR